MLSLQSLEGRETPAGSLSATLSPLGALVITGDDDANVVTLRVNAGDVVLTPAGGTTVNSQGSAVTLPGVVKSIKADFKGGADSVDIDNTVNFIVSGAVALTLGDGDNVLNLTTSEQISLGSLTVKAGDGEDTVTIQGGTGKNSQVVKAASLSLSNGGSTTTLGDIRLGAGAKLVAGDAVGAVANTVIGTNVNSVKTFSAELANTNGATLSFTDSVLGGLKVTGFVTTSILQNTTVNGSVTVKAGYEGLLELDTATVTGSVSITGALAELSASGGGSTINGNLSLTGSGWTTTSFDTTTLSEVKGNVTVKGGWFSDQFIATSQFKVGKNMSFTMNGGDNTVALGDGLAAITFGGSLKYKGGAGVDTITLDRVTFTGSAPLGGSASIQTLAGKDVISIEDGTSFLKTFTADLGTGDDTFSAGQIIGAAGAVTFTGNAKILGGVGDDTLLLGLAIASGGDANSKTVFSGTKNLVDGGTVGTGIDIFSAADGQFTGVTPVNWNP